MESAPLIISFAAGFALLIFVAMTSFLKLSVVLMIVRQALGMQSIPSNMILMALSLFISIFVLKPVFVTSVFQMTSYDANFETPQDIFNFFQAGIQPFQAFITLHTKPEYLEFLINISEDLWASSGAVATGDDILVQVPAFMLSELTQAFEIGFLLYLPFVAIDLAVTGILMALGMQMVQPNIIAVPFKLLTFVFIDGWSRLIEGMLMTYVV